MRLEGAKSEVVAAMDAIQADVHRFLKPQGFGRRGRSHNRRTSGGLAHVVTFQTGQYPIGNYVIPGLRESYYGRFAVNLGVLLPCIRELEHRLPAPAFAHDFHCTIRSRLAFGEVCWFNIGSDTAGLGAQIVGLLDRTGLGFFDPFQSYEDVLVYYDAHGDLPFQNEGRAALEAALVAHHLHDASRAASLFARASTTGREVFRQYVAELAARFGYATA